MQIEEYNALTDNKELRFNRVWGNVYAELADI